MPSMLETMFAQQAQPKPQDGMMGKLKSFLSPSSTAGKLSNRDLYNQYASKAAESGDDVISFEDFLAAMQQYQAKTK